MDGGDGDFTVEISLGIVLRLRLWMAVGPRGAWERSDGGDGDFMVEIAAEISPGIVLRSQLWMAVGPRKAWERSDGGDGDFTVEISSGIVLRSRLWMAVGPRGAWEGLDGGDGEEKESRERAEKPPQIEADENRSAIEVASDPDSTRTGLLVLSIAKNQCARAHARATISLSDVLVRQESVLLMIVMICGF